VTDEEEAKAEATHQALRAITAGELPQRVSALHGSPVYHPVSERLSIFLDGRELENVFEADVAEGWAKAFLFPPGAPVPEGATLIEAPEDAFHVIEYRGALLFALDYEPPKAPPA
jgi:hypothetical protein